MADHYPPDEMPEETWDLIERARGDEDRMEEILGEEDPETIRRFIWNYVQAAAYLCYPPWADEYRSEDTNEDLAYHVVSKGRAYYKRVFDDPKRMPKRGNVSGFVGAAKIALLESHGEEYVPPRDVEGFIHP